MRIPLIIVCALFVNDLIGQNVNPFNGAFNYNVPLLNIPSNRGAPISLDANYSGGIQVSQNAGEIGLGWNLNAGGAIYRSASGIPDDCLNHQVADFSINSYLLGAGSLYPMGSSTAVTKYDFTSTRRGLDTTEFTFPDFYNYYLNAPGFSTALKLSYNKFYAATNYSSTELNLTPDGTFLPSEVSYQRPQFRFAGDFADTLTCRHYSNTVSGISPFNVPTTSLTGNGFTNSAQPFIGSHLNGTLITNQNFDITSGKLATSNLVEYFTNAEINAAAAGSFAASPGATLHALNNFIDYKSIHTRTSTIFPSEGIGAFRITGSNGVTYHYSLPVYQLENKTYKIPLNSDYSIPATISSTMFLNNYSNYVSGNSEVLLYWGTLNRFAYKWELTAITGPDYKDSNGNHQVDDSDEGYWISYDYQQWSSSFTQRFPQYGFNYSFEPHEKTKYNPNYCPITSTQYKLSGLFGTISETKSEVYHLSQIKSSSHSAIFIRDIRLDEKGGDASITHTSSTKPAPDLKVSRIVLFKNTELDSILATYPKSSFTNTLYPQFDFTNVTNSSQFYTESWWQNAPNWKYCVLKHVEFDHDYSLCKKYYGNVYVDCNNSSVLTPPSAIESSLTVTTNSLSGKLTLNRILFYDFQNIKLSPSIKFDYDKNNTIFANSNPDFNPRKTDYWGYYKSDASILGYSGYTTKTSRKYTKAWSLLKITDPLGGLTEVEYESNEYSKVLDIESTTGFRGAAFLYPISAASGTNNNIGNTFTVTMEEGFSSSTLTELTYLRSDSITGLTKKICIPYTGAISYTSALPQGVDRGFFNGECTYSLVSGAQIRGSIPSPTGTCSSTLMCRGCNAISQNPVRVFVGSNNWTFTTVDNPNFLSQVNVTYPGGGFIKLETPIGYRAYGGGVRVKNIKLTNQMGETYVTQYKYEDGVATNEADRFEYPRIKKRCNGSVLRFDFLQPKDYTPFDMESEVPYKLVELLTSPYLSVF